jgi:hypothetical protein
MRNTLYEWVEKDRKELYVLKLTAAMWYLVEGSGPLDGNS